MRFPNGYGSIYNLGGNRRKPWAVRLPGEKYTTPNGSVRYKQKYLGYYETREEAIYALAMYNENPYDINAKKITFAEVFDKWSDEHFKKISDSNIKGYQASYKCCSELYDIHFADIKLAHLQHVVDTCGKNYPTLRKLKVLFNSLYKYAMQHDICGKDYSQFIDIIQYKDKNPNTIDRSPFQEDEIKRLWSVSDDEYAMIALMLIYGGCRVSELLDLKKEDVHLDEKYYDITKSKTKSGIRKVPIADKVFPFFEHWMRSSGTYLLCTPEGKHFTYRNYFDSYWKPIMEQLNIDHRPHDARHTCISLLTMAGVDDRIIKKIVGHSGKTVTEMVYTHFEMDPLLKAINMI